MSGAMPPRLQLVGITKRYPAVVANSDVALTVQPGEIHAVLGENGAGKSTLMKIIYGAVKPDAGEMRFNGEVVNIRNPQEARRLGISMVFQHFSLFDTLTVAENVWLGLDKSLKLPEVTARITEVAASGDADGVQYEVTGLRHLPGKWDAIERNQPLSTRPTRRLTDAAPPVASTVWSAAMVTTLPCLMSCT